MKKRGRPPKKHKIEVTSKRRSAFDLARFGVKPKEDKDYRWSTPDRVREHQNLDGYELHKAKEGETKNESGNVETRGKMVLMERDKRHADRSRAEKAMRTERQTRSIRDVRRDEIERLSSKHGVDLHKHFLNKLEKQEREG